MLREAVVWELRGGLGLTLDALELYLGYARAQIDHVALGGPMLGARIWL